MSVKRTSSEINEEDRLAFTSSPKRRLVDNPSGSVEASNDENKRGENKILADKLKASIERSLKQLMELNPTADMLKVWSNTLTTLNCVNEEQENSEVTVSDSEWGQFKLEKIHQIAVNISHKIDDIKRKSFEPHIHHHTSPDCRLCNGCRTHIEESITRRLLPFLDESAQSGRGQSHRGSFGGRGLHFARNRGGRQPGLESRRFSYNFDN